MFKLTFRNYIKIIIAFFLICVFISGCSRYVKEETTQIIEIKDKGQQDKKAQPEENQKEKLSKMYNWDNARIPIEWYYPNFGEGQILQNQEYIFFPEDGNKVVRINKLNGQKKTICEFDFIEEKFIHYCLSDDGIFVEYNSNIYFCDFDGENMHKVISRKNLKEQITSIKKDGWKGG